MEEHGVEVVRRVYEAFRDGDVPGVLGAMATDVEWLRPRVCRTAASITAARR
jgi:ketosteroid isomerase-like protein